MSPRPVIFISAVSSELKTARQLVANTLTFLGYEPEWQDIFGAEEGDLRAMLRRRIDASAGVVALIGQRYGAEPLEPDAQFGRVSYTQYEALYARKAGKKVWPLLLDENFLTDPCNPESDELRALQHACRERIRADIHLYQPLTDSTALEATILKLRDDLGQLRRGVKQWALTVIALLIVLIAAAAWLVQSQRQQSHAVSALLERNQKVEHALIRLAEVEMNQKQPGEKLTADEQRGRAYATLEKDLSLSPGSLAKELPAFALELYSSPEASLLLRARAAYALNKFDEAEKLSFQFAGQERAVLEKAVQTADESRHSAIAALELAGQSAQKQIRWPRALEYLQAAAALTSRERDPEEWARVQHAIASVLYDLGRAREVEAILREVVAERARTLGPEHPDTLKSWSDLANALDVQGKYAEAEREDRALLAIRERIFGPTNLNTVKSRGNLAVTLAEQDRYVEAEQEYRAVLAILKHVLGPEHPDTLVSWNNLAATLSLQGKYAEAEREYRAVLAILERIPGPGDPRTLRCRSNLAIALAGQGKYAEAEQEQRAALALRERVLGPEHPDTLKSRSNLAEVLDQQDKHAEAETEHRVVLASRERALGPEHPQTLESRSNLAAALAGQSKHAEAEAEYRAVLALRERVLGAKNRACFESCHSLARALRGQAKLAEALEFAQRARAGMKEVLGEEHPDFKDSAKLCEEIEAALAKEKADGR